MRGIGAASRIRVLGTDKKWTGVSYDSYNSREWRQLNSNGSPAAALIRAKISGLRQTEGKFCASGSLVASCPRAIERLRVPVRRHSTSRAARPSPFLIGNRHRDRLSDIAIVSVLLGILRTRRLPRRRRRRFGPEQWNRVLWPRRYDRGLRFRAVALVLALRTRRTPARRLFWLAKTILEGHLTGRYTSVVVS